MPINLAAKVTRAPLERLIRLAYDGELPVQGVDASAVGLGRILISSSEAWRAVRRQRAPGLCLEEARAILGLRQEMLPLMHEVGLAEICDVGKLRIVTQAEVDRLKATYATAADVAAALGGVHVKTAAGVMAKQGFLPACPRPPFEQVLYLRADVDVAVAVELARRRAEEEAAGPKVDLLTQAQAARVMGVSSAQLRSLIDDGHVRWTRFSRGAGISVPDAEQFAATYAAPGELAGILGKESALAAKAALARSGVEPAFAAPAFPGTLYRRIEAVKALEATSLACRRRDT